MSRMRRILIALATITVVLSCVTFGLEVSGYFALQTALVNGEPLSADEAGNLGMVIGESVFQQDCAVVSSVMCRRKGIGSADVAIRLPNTIAITTNSFETELLVYDASAKSVFSLDERQCLTPTSQSIGEYVGPLVVGLSNLKLYEKPDDFRIIAVAKSLKRLKEEHEKWYSAVSEIDFSHEGYLGITIDGFDFLTLAPADRIDVSLEALFLMAEGSPEALANASEVNLCFAGQVIVSHKSE